VTRIGIAIPYFHRPETVQDVIYAIREHCNYDHVIMVCEMDAKRDFPYEKYAHDDDVLYIHSDVNRGIGYARSMLHHYLLRVEPRVSHILQMDDDFLVQQGYFDVLFEALRENSRLGAVGGVSEFTKGAPFYKSSDHCTTFFAPVPYENMLVSREIAEQVGNYDERLWYYEDTDWCIRLRRIGKDFHMVHGADCIQDWRHPGGIQQNFDEEDRERLKGNMGRLMVEKYGDLVELTDPPDWKLIVNWRELPGCTSVS
jgi:GT2 family glycosyltransferase